MGNVRKHGKGWQLIYQVAGKRHWETIKAKNESEARRVLKIREGKAWDPRNAPELADAPTFDDLCELIETDYQMNQRRTADKLQLRLKHLRASFGGLTTDKITGERIGEYITQRLTDGAAHATVNRELAALKRMLNLAHRAGRTIRVHLIPHLKEAKPRHGFFEEPQFLRVLEALPEHLRPVARFAYFTGWRRSEIISLTWTQVDLSARVIRLWPGTTKNEEGRVLKLEGEILAIIEGQRALLPQGCPWVFHRKGRAIRSFYKAWRNACNEAGCPGMLFHDLRRTAARDFRRAGLQEKEAMKMTGHKTRSVFDRYNIVDESDLADIAWRAQAYKAARLAECAKACQNSTLIEEKPEPELIEKQGK